MVIFKSYNELERFSDKITYKLAKLAEKYNTSIFDFPGLKELIPTYDDFKDLCDYLDTNFTRWDFLSEIGNLYSIPDNTFQSIFNLPDYSPEIYFECFKIDLNIDIFLREYESDYADVDYIIYPEELLEIISNVLGIDIDYDNDLEYINFPVYIPSFTEESLVLTCSNHIISEGYINGIEDLILNYIRLNK